MLPRPFRLHPRGEGGLFPPLSKAEVVWKSSQEMTDLIGDYLTRHDPWRPVVDDNWHIGRELAAEQELAAPAHVAGGGPRGSGGKPGTNR